MKRVQFSATYPERLVHPLHRRLTEERSVSRAELLMWSPTADATTLLRCDGPREATERLVGGVDSVAVSNFVADGDGTYAFLRQDDYEFAAALLDTIAGARVVFLPPVVFLDADEFNQRRTQLEELPANRDLADVLDVDAATVDEFLSDIVRDLTLTNVDDSEMNAHLNEMRKEVAARVRGGDA